MSTHLSTTTLSTLDHTLPTLGTGSLPRSSSRQAADRFAQTRAVAERRAGTARRPSPGSLWQRARGVLSRPRPA
jgi:hypothetical protein